MVNAAKKGTGPLASMTGYASREGDVSGSSWSWEIRSVNGRGLDIRCRLPDGLGALEAPLRKRLTGVLARGQVSVSLKPARHAASSGPTLNPDALAASMAQIVQLQQTAADEGLALTAPSVSELLAMPGVTETGGVALPSVDALLEDADPLISAFCAMRAAEGQAIKEILTAQIDRIATLTEQAQSAAAARDQTQGERLKLSVKSLLETHELDPDRLAQEVALLAVKSDVTEEIDRLRAHVAAARDLLAKGGPVGRKLDFLMQEFNREANTLCSKSQDAALTAIGLDLKLAIDQTREQVQNLE